MLKIFELAAPPGVDGGSFDQPASSIPSTVDRCIGTLALRDVPEATTSVELTLSVSTAGACELSCTAQFAAEGVSPVAVGSLSIPAPSA